MSAVEPIRLFEVSLRDGLQNEPVVVSTEDKLAIAVQLVAAGFRDIEATSFVHPRWVPQLADADELIARLPRPPGVRWWALVPNGRGFERAAAAGIQHVGTVLSASESHNLKNVNRTLAESLADLRAIVGSARDLGMTVRSYISCALACPFEGEVPPAQVVRLAAALRDAGAQQIVVGDTTGSGHPEQVKSLLGALYAVGFGADELALHCHDTQGTALANLYSAWQEGVRCFDGSIGGVGGCPFAPGAAGNVGTEDLVHLFERLGGAHEPPEGHGPVTGVDLAAACAAGDALEHVLGRPLPGRYHRYLQARQPPRARSA